MSTSSPVAALEIGTGRITLAVAERQPSGRLKITGVKSLESSGVRKSRITGLNNVKKTIQAVVRDLQDAASVDISNAWLAVSGPGVETKPLKGAWRTDMRKITDDDVAAVEENATENNGLDGSSRMVLHNLSQDFVLDGRTGISNPVGMTGQQLERRALCVHYALAQFDDAREAAAASHVEIPNAAFSGCCAARAVLGERERQDGVLVIDLGAGSTSYIAFTCGYVAAAGSIAAGGDHVTADLATAFGITRKQAEGLKIAEGCAVLRSESAGRRISIPSTTPGFQARSVSARAVETVVNARMDEIFRMVQDRLEASGPTTSLLAAGCVLTGGGAAMPRVCELAASTLGLPARIGEPVNVDGLENDPFPAALAVPAGLALLAADAEEAAAGERGGFMSMFKRIFS